MKKIFGVFFIAMLAITMFLNSPSTKTTDVNLSTMLSSSIANAEAVLILSGCHEGAYYQSCRNGSEDISGCRATKDSEDDDCAVVVN